MGLEAAAAFVLKRDTELHAIWMEERKQPAERRTLSTLIGAVEAYGAQEAYRAVVECTELFDVRKDVCVLTPLGRKVAKLCEDYDIWGKTPFRTHMPGETYLRMVVDLSAAGFTTSDVHSALGRGTAETIPSLLLKKWIAEIAEETYKFTRRGLAYKIVLATILAEVDSSNAEHYRALSAALSQLIKGEPPVSGIEEEMAELERLEGKLAVCETHIGEYTQQRQELLLRIAELRVREPEFLAVAVTELETEFNGIGTQIADLSRGCVDNERRINTLKAQLPPLCRVIGEKEVQVAKWAKDNGDRQVSRLQKEIAELKAQVQPLEKKAAQLAEKEAALLKLKREAEARLAEAVGRWTRDRKDVDAATRKKVDIAVFGYQLDTNVEWSFHHVSTAYERFKGENKLFFMAGELMLTGKPDEKAALDAVSSQDSGTMLFRVETLNRCAEILESDEAPQEQSSGMASGGQRYIPTFWAISLMILYEAKKLTKGEVMSALSDPSLKSLKGVVAPQMQFIRKQLYEKPFRGIPFSGWKALMVPRPVA